MLREYRYRQIVPMTHDQYLDEPDDIIEWTLRLRDIESSRTPPGTPGKE